MDTQNPSARTCAPGGIVHENTRPHTRFTVVGNHLAQHRGLFGLAIGLAVHIQSLPAGARADIRTLAARFPEGTTRIAAALNELEAHGYLRRERLRTPDGRVRTRTVSCNQPGAAQSSIPAPPPKPVKKKPRPLAVPHPVNPRPALLRVATDLLATLHRTDARLALPARDIERLAPGVTAWLERDLTPSAVRHALVRGLPDDRTIHSPAALLAHRLTAQLPPWPSTFSGPAEPPPVRHPLRNCDTCDRAYRGPEPGRCPGCGTAAQGAPPPAP
ncbi:helix-turn-helix domain-containing protein [Streptomyces endophyticus]|uniref:Helix-turn-helix domain-containing protein n=1 Tax=Streptomyces endophyticus TaxID=714166 RepID=A0ABU6FJ36_9ACTN|nr:helix-turn-helix domain-containing protein [Streptomyces endophyticus]MEB8344066.1 helix-turn-helix domain-containing protein [Streptomyces endophyticus]